jgi:hypothetical protein
MVGLLILVPGGLSAQGSDLGVARLTAEENFRRTPNGEVLARLDRGTPVLVVARDQQWVQVDLEGWVWTRSLQVSADSEFDLVVSEPEGENLRDAPSGSILGRLGRGTLVEEIRRDPGWVLVRRQGWIWAESVGDVASAPRESPPASVAAAADRPAGPETRRPVGFTAVGDDGAVILAAPDGDTLARTVPQAELQVTARQGNWVRVRLEGWMWQPNTQVSEDAAGSPEGLTPDDVAREPEEFTGRVISWRLQFISQERAEAVRTDFFEAEPFLLCRFGGAGGPFVYVTVPPDRLGEVAGLVPLEFLSVTGRVRTGASALTGTPIIDLLSFERERGSH